MDLSINMPVSKIPLVGSIYAKRLEKLEIETARDLIHHYPFRYNDYSIISKIINLQPEETVTIQGNITSIQNIYTKYGKKLQRAKVADDTGEIEIVWFNQPFLTKTLKKGINVSLSGKVSQFGKKITLESPEYEIIRQGKTIHTGRIVPVYPETNGISSKWLRSRIAFLLARKDFMENEYLPEEIRQKKNLMPYPHAIFKVHFPETEQEKDQARERLAFDELFEIQLTSALRKRQWGKETIGKKFKVANCELRVEDFIKSLPFKLTQAQEKCINEILSDLEKSKPMNRLLQGDVGSGKTVVAAVAIYISFLNGFTSALMAPTEILAFQHFETIKEFLEPLGLKVALFTSSNKTKNTENVDVFIGTHALIYQKINFGKLGLVVIDEQHRFGVEQRSELKKKDANPHLLTMTATPIPRSVALTLYGELDLSYIDEMPKDRQKVKTWLVPEKKRDSAYSWVAKKLKENKGQAFVVCPLIEESEHETMQSIKAAAKEYERLRKKVFPDFKLSLLHGRMTSKEKDKVIEKFRNKKADILVSTPVVEVGIDIPNAIMMIIEAAERFGLAQLHQLRGRVGRGAKQSFCLLFAENSSKMAYRRLKSLENIYNGARLSEIDLEFRGAGAIFGTKQHGFLKLKIASLTDHKLISEVKQTVSTIINGNEYFKENKELARKAEEILKQKVEAN